MCKCCCFNRNGMNSLLNFKQNATFYHNLGSPDQKRKICKLIKKKKLKNKLKALYNLAHYVAMPVYFALSLAGLIIGNLVII